MKILFDQGTPAPLRHALPAGSVSTLYELGWSTLRNGDLLARAETDGFTVLVTTDQKLKYQQQLAGRRLAICVLSTTSWPRIKLHLAHVRETVLGMTEGGYIEIVIP